VTALGFSPDGRRVAAGSSDGRVEVWDVTAGGAVPGEAEKLRQQLDEARLREQEQRREAERSLYASRIAQAQLAWFVGEPKDEKHKDARQFIYHVWPTLDTAGLKANLGKAQEALAVCRRVGDVTAAGRLFRATEAQAVRLRKEADGLRPDVNIDHQKPAELIKEVAPGLEKLAADVKAFIDRKQPAD